MDPAGRSGGGRRGGRPSRVPRAPVCATPPRRHHCSGVANGTHLFLPFTASITRLGLIRINIPDGCRFVHVIITGVVFGIRDEEARRRTPVVDVT
ncbi:hypothetical protein EVAR_84809_1 [Eumeta japonica]|uniref:Uncharacterized protein n=1 Tax=Eumeta variegata TaxID=151549 RepID=A0A4C1U8C4_EUMVA|nr:hypothetical protein EVAR_84809_1 [Eumeta japonica]